MYAVLQKSGHLVESSLLDKGLPHHQAWEMAREEWTFLPSEDALR